MAGTYWKAHPELMSSVGWAATTFCLDSAVMTCCWVVPAVIFYSEAAATMGSKAAMAKTFSSVHSALIDSMEGQTMIASGGPMATMS